MRKVFTGHGPRHWIGACEGHYDDSDELQPPKLEGTIYQHVFVQTTSYTRKLRKDSKFLFCKLTQSYDNIHEKIHSL